MLLVLLGLDAFVNFSKLGYGLHKTNFRSFVYRHIHLDLTEKQETFGIHSYVIPH